MSVEGVGERMWVELCTRQFYVFACVHVYVHVCGCLHLRPVHSYVVEQEHFCYRKNTFQKANLPFEKYSFCSRSEVYAVMRMHFMPLCSCILVHESSLILRNVCI